MWFKRYYAGHLAHASYLVADQGSGIAAVVDPQPDIAPYLQDAEQHRLQIRWVLLTHLHTDFVPGHLALRDRAGARIGPGARARVEPGFTLLGNDELIELVPRLRLRVLAAPGRAPEAIVILIHDLHHHDEHPWAALTGDTLLIGDVGRPDTSPSAPGTGRDELARCLYRTLHTKLLTLSDDTLVYPAHGAGAVCGRSPSTDWVSTIGTQRRYNFALQPMSEREFVHLIVSEPDDAEPDGRVADTTPSGGSEPPPAFELTEALRMRDVGAQVLDVRSPLDFAGAHVAEALNVPLNASFSSVAGSLLRHDVWTIVVADPGREGLATMRLRRLGFDTVGYLARGIQALAGRHDLVRRSLRVTAVSLAEELHAPAPPALIDVRPRHQWRAGRIEGSINVPLEQFPMHWHAVPRRRWVVVYSEHGGRSSTAASLLVRHGVEDVCTLVGGLSAWRASALPETRGPWHPFIQPPLVRSFTTRFAAPVLRS